MSENARTTKTITYAEWLQTFEREVGLARSILSIFAPIDVDDTIDGFVFVGASDGPAYTYSMFAALTEAGVAPADFETVLAAAKADRSWFEAYSDLTSYDDERAPAMVARGLKQLGAARVGKKGKPPASMVVMSYDVIRDGRSLPVPGGANVPEVAIAIYPSVSGARVAPSPSSTKEAPVAKVTPTEATSSSAATAPVRERVAPDTIGAIILVRLGRSGVIVGRRTDSGASGFLQGVQDYLSSRLVGWTPEDDRVFQVGDEYYALNMPDFLGELLPFTEYVHHPHGMAASAVVPIRVELPLDGTSVDYLEPGVGVLVAPTSWGKSIFLLRGLKPALEAAGHQVSVVSYNEPIEQATLAAEAVVVYEPAHLLARVAAWLLNDKASVLLVDSLRAFVYSKSAGGTGTKGFDQLLFTQLTALSNAALVTGRLAVFSLNPLVDDDDETRVKEIHDGVRASVTTAMLGRNSPSRSLSVERRGLSNTDRTAMTGQVKTLITEADAMVSAGIVIEDPTPGAVPEQFVPAHLARLLNTH